MGRGRRRARVPGSGRDPSSPGYPTSARGLATAVPPGGRVVESGRRIRSPRSSTEARNRWPQSAHLPSRPMFRTRIRRSRPQCGQGMGTRWSIGRASSAFASLLYATNLSGRSPGAEAIQEVAEPGSRVPLPTPPRWGERPWPGLHGNGGRGPAHPRRRGRRPSRCRRNGRQPPRRGSRAARVGIADGRDHPIVGADVGRGRALVVEGGEEVQVRVIRGGPAGVRRRGDDRRATVARRGPDCGRGGRHAIP